MIVVGASAPARFPSFHVHTDVMLVLGAMILGYFVLLRRVGPRSVAPGAEPATRFQVACFSIGMSALYLASSWPIHDIAERSLYSVHMTQHVVYSLVAAPLLLLGTPGWMLRTILRPRGLFVTVRFLSRFLPALILFNLVLVLTHWPAVVNATIEQHAVHFIAHVVLMVSSLIVWMPVLSPLPEIPRLTPIGRMVFLFSQSIVPTVPASFLTFGRTPLYSAYTKFPHLWGATTIQDQLIAGLIMKIAAGLLLWAVIAVVWFRWSAREERVDRVDWRKLDRTLDQMRVTNS
ncbi:MAG: cytochrome c oxidase assembly protein [Acidimicrobiia bacterium]